MKKSKLMKALLVFGMSMVTATAIVGFTACNDECAHEDKDGNGKCDICDETLEPETPLKVAVEKVELNKSEITLEIGEEETLTATVTPDNADNKTVTWSSNKPEIAMVVGGKVTAKAAGTATITATADGKSATCSVTVNAPAPKPEVTAEEWAQILEGVTGATVEMHLEGVLISTLKLDGVKAHHVAADGSETIYAEDEGSYYKYEKAEGEWAREEISEEDFNSELEEDNGYLAILKSLSAYYDEFDYADGKYGVSEIEDIKNIEITFDNGALVSVKFEVSELTMTYGNVNATTITLPTIGGETPDPDDNATVTAEEWAQILDGANQYTIEQLNDKNGFTAKVDGDKVLTEIDAAGLKLIYVADGESYHRYAYNSVAQEWEYNDIDETEYGTNTDLYKNLLKSLKDDYSAFTYADGVYTAETIDKTESLNETLKEVKITFENGALVGLEYGVEHVGATSYIYYSVTGIGSTTVELPTIGGETPDPEIPNITSWTEVGDPIYNESTVDGVDHIWHHIYLQDSEKKYDFDSYTATVKLDGEDGTVVEELFDAPSNENENNYHLKIHVLANKYQTAVFTIAFKKDGETVATGTYTRVGDKEVILVDDKLSVSLDATEPASFAVLKINGKTDFTGYTINWSISDNSIATIEDTGNGTVAITAVAEGTATLTCTIGTGDDAFSAACTITVVAGEVKEEDPVDVSDKLFEQETYGDYYINIRLECDAELGGKIDSVEVSATMDGESVTARMHNFYGGNTPKYVQIQVYQDWTHDYVFTVNYKNTAGKVIATGTFSKVAPKVLTLDKSALNLTLKDGEDVTETITATTKKIEGAVEWSIDDTSVATITDNGDGTVTVTAVAKGTAIITAKADGLEKTCTVNVIEEGDDVPDTVPTVTVARIIEVYGGDVHCGVLLDGSDALAGTYSDVLSQFAYVKVNGVKNNDMKDMFAYGADGSYRVNAFMGGAVQKGVDYVFELCDADGNVLLKTVALQWN